MHLCVKRLIFLNARLRKIIDLDCNRCGRSCATNSGRVSIAQVDNPVNAVTNTVYILSRRENIPTFASIGPNP